MSYGDFLRLSRFIILIAFYLDFWVVLKVYLHRKLSKLQMMFLQHIKTKVVMICWEELKIKLEQLSKLMRHWLRAKL
nr:hypothetical protein Iba_chr08dCG14660 [Ipomoea batatas]GME07117.1 hypothetical protein Iba_scaffold5908CG0120 [Ipomoea batatas]